MEYEKQSISVRNLVEFILRSGDIDASHSHTDTDAMQEGAALHRKIQKSMGPGYRAEVALKKDFLLEKDDLAILLTLEGRADGIEVQELLTGTVTTIDEIKTSLSNVEHLSQPVPEHLAQAKCYAAIYGEQEGLEDISVQMTYVTIEKENINRFNYDFKVAELCEWLGAVVQEYSKWLFWEAEWKKKRDASIKELKFPFDYRPGQKELVAGVYKTITRGRRLFIEAPTGVGKTISTVFPAIHAMGEKKADKIFYLTAKTIARTVAEDTFSLLSERGLSFRFITITSKEKSCVLDKPECNPAACPRAKGHYDRVNDCIFAMLNEQETITRDLVFMYAEKYQVCPFEMCLDVSLWTDAVICDYNYAFDPRASLKRFFAEGIKNPYILLIDEAHNLVERAREMYSAELVKEDFLTVKRMVAPLSKRMEKYLEAANKLLLSYKRQCEEFQVWDDCDELYNSLQRLLSVYEDFFDEYPGLSENRAEIMDLFFKVRTFVLVYEKVDENYRIFTDYLPSGDFRIKLMCMEPAKQLRERMDNVRASILFSATLLPMNYYKEQLGGDKDDYAVYAPSPFKKENRLIMIGNDVSTVYKKRSREEFEKIAGYISDFTGVKKGNYMVFFPSYKMMEDVAELMENRGLPLVIQKRDMTETEKEEFLGGFVENSSESRIAFCVMGGIFSEGIDLTGDRLNGAIIVGCGLPQVGFERELFKFYFDEKNGNGFEYSYLYPGMNKVMQSAGRVIRTASDRGAILLLDDRFLRNQYLELFPQEWFPYDVVNRETCKRITGDFYNGK